MSWIYCFIGVSHFAEFHEKQLVIVWEMLDVLECPILQWWGKVIQNLFLERNHHQMLSDFSDW